MLYLVTWQWTFVSLSSFATEHKLFLQKQKNDDEKFFFSPLKLVLLKLSIYLDLSR